MIKTLGIIVLLGLGLALAPTTRAEEPSLPSPTEVIARYIEALGGEEALSAATSMKVTGTFEIGTADMSGTFSSMMSLPDLYRISISIDGFGEVQQGYLHGVGWDDDPMQGSVLLEAFPNHVRGMRADLHADLHYDTLFDTLTTVGFVEFEGRPCVEIRCVTGEGYWQQEYFDTETGLLVGRKFQETMGGGMMEMVSVLSDYQEHAGRLVAMRQQYTGAMGTQSITLKMVSFNPLPESVFDPPAGVKTLMTKQAEGTKP